MREAGRSTARHRYNDARARSRMPRPRRRAAAHSRPDLDRMGRPSRGSVAGRARLGPRAPRRSLAPFSGRRTRSRSRGMGIRFVEPEESASSPAGTPRSTMAANGTLSKSLRPVPNPGRSSPSIRPRSWIGRAWPGPRSRRAPSKACSSTTRRPPSCGMPTVTHGCSTCPAPLSYRSPDRSRSAHGRRRAACPPPPRRYSR